MQGSLFEEFFALVEAERTMAPIVALEKFLQRGVRPKTRRTDSDRLRPFLVRFESITDITAQDIDC